MLDPIQYKIYGNSKPGLDQSNRSTSLVTTEERNIKNKLADDEEFFRIMELIKTEKSEEFEYKNQTGRDEISEECEDVSYFMLFMMVSILLAAKVIQGFQNVIVRVKELFDQCFPYIWNWMKTVTRGTYSVTDGKVGLFLLCVPMLTMFLLLYCSLLTFNAVTELLLGNAPACVTQAIVSEKITKMLNRKRLQI